MAQWLLFLSRVGKSGTKLQKKPVKRSEYEATRSKASKTFFFLHECQFQGLLRCSFKTGTLHELTTFCSGKCRIVNTETEGYGP
jgi:hypothetical protein